MYDVKKTTDKYTSIRGELLQKGSVKIMCKWIFFKVLSP